MKEKIVIKERAVMEKKRLLVLLLAACLAVNSGVYAQELLVDGAGVSGSEAVTTKTNSTGDVVEGSVIMDGEDTFVDDPSVINDGAYVAEDELSLFAAADQNASENPVIEDFLEISGETSDFISFEENASDQETELAEESEEDTLQSQEAVTDEYKDLFVADEIDSGSLLETDTVKSGPEIVNSGTCGSLVNWTLDSEGLLTISGYGYMKNYSHRRGSDFPIFQDMNIKTIVILNDVMSIGDFAFQNCRNLTSITIPDSLKYIGEYAFDCCESLTSVTIPDSVKIIGNMAFDYCESLTSVTLPNSLTRIENFTFRHTGLKSITIPSSVTSIGKQAFNNCFSLASLTIPEGVVEICDQAFSHCNSMTTLTLPNSLRSIGEEAFFLCQNLKSVTIPTGVTEITSECFGGCSSLTSVTLPDTLEKIQSECFAVCDNLKNMRIPDSVTEIASNAFDSTPITLWGSEGSYAQSYAMSNGINFMVLKPTPTPTPTPEVHPCGDNLTYTYDEGILSIRGTGPMWDKEDMFSSLCETVTDIIIAHGVTSIGDSAFKGFRVLGAIMFPDSMTWIGNSSFANCFALIDVEIPDSVDYIGRNAFDQCNKLEHVKILGRETRINEGAFMNNDILTIEGYGSSTAEIYAIQHSITFNELYESSLDPSDSYVGNHIIENGSIYMITGADTVSYLYPIVAQKKVSIPNMITVYGKKYKVNQITASAFTNNFTIKSVSIGKNVTFIENNAFQNAKNLKNIVIKSKKIISIGKNAFTGTSHKLVIKVPNKKLTAYEEMLKNAGFKGNIKKN